MVVGLALKNRICTACAARVVTRTRADADSPTVLVTVRRNVYACPVPAVKLVIAEVGLDSATDGPVSWIHRNVSASPFGSWELEPFKVMVPAGTPIWSGPASAIGGDAPFMMFRLTTSYRTRGTWTGTGYLESRNSFGRSRLPHWMPNTARPLLPRCPIMVSLTPPSAVRAKRPYSGKINRTVPPTRSPVEYARR